MKKIYCLLLLLGFYSLIGCSGNKTFPNAVRAGDTASIALGWQKQFLPHNTTVTITPSVGNPVIISAGDPAIRGIINFYPDPVSYMVVGTETRQDGESFNFGATYGDMVNNNFTFSDKDWWQTIAFINMPATLPFGTADITLTNTNGDIKSSIIEIIEGSGEPALFDAKGLGPMTRTQMASLERSFVHEVSFSGSTIPTAIEITISRDQGKVYVVNPRGDLKNLTWSDDGSFITVNLISTKLDAPSHILDFKFYVAGGYRGLSLQDLTVQSIHAFDKDGYEISGITASIESN